MADRSCRSSSRGKKRARRFGSQRKRLYDSPLASVICLRKRRFDTRRAAKSFLRERDISTQEPYSCEGCAGVHLRTKQRRPACT